MSKLSFKLDYQSVYPALLLFLSAISCVTSAGGVYSWFSDQIASGVAIAIAFGLSGFIQIAIAGMWFGVISRLIPLFIKPLCLVLALGMSVVSGGLASGSWMLLTAGGEMQNLLNERNFTSVSQPLIALKGRLDDFDNSMRNLVVLSQRKETQEDKLGNSCDGAPVAVGYGPRARLRNRLAREASEQSARAAELSLRALDLAMLPKDATDADFRAAHRGANQLVRDPAIEELRVWLEETHRSFRNGFIDDAGDGATFLCRDRDTEVLLIGTMKLMQELPQLDALPPRAEAFTFAQSVKNSYKQIFRFLGISDEAQDEDWDADVLEVAWIAFAFAGGVEVVIVLLVALTAAVSNAGLINGAPIGIPLKELRRVDCERQVALLNRLVIEERRAFYFCVPEDGESELRDAARDFVRRWQLLAAPGGTAVILKDISPVADSLMKARDVDASRFTLYPLPGRLCRWWTRAVRDLAATISDTGFECRDSTEQVVGKKSVVRKLF